MRARGLLRDGATQAQRSLFLEHVPVTSDIEVQHFFEQMFGRKCIHSCVLQRNTYALHRLLELNWCAQLFLCCCSRRNRGANNHSVSAAASALDSFDSERDAATRDTTRRIVQSLATEPMVAPITHSARRPRLQTATSQATVADSYESLFSALRRAVDSSQQTTSTAFVTFYSVADRVIAEQLVLSYDYPDGWQASPAPLSNGTIWRNVTTPLPSMKICWYIILGWTAFGLLFWSVPVAAIQGAAANSIALEHRSGLRRWQLRWAAWVLEFYQRYPTRYALIRGYLPVLVLMGLLLVLPYIIRAHTIRFEHLKTKSSVERTVMRRNILFQLATLYVTVLSGSLIQSLRLIANQPGCTFAVLRSEIPGVAVYFITFVLATIGLSVPTLLLYPILYCCCIPGLKPVAVRCYYCIESTNAAIVLVVGLTYSFIAPAIMPVCAVYFGVASITYRWLFRYVYEPEFECSGAFWYDLFDGLFVGMMLGAGTLTATVSLYSGKIYGGAFSGFAALSPLCGLVMILYWHCIKQFKQASLHMAYEDAVAVDRDLPELASTFPKDHYEDPVMKIIKKHGAASFAEIALPKTSYNPLDGASLNFLSRA